MKRKTITACICQWKLGKKIKQKQYRARTIWLTNKGVKEEIPIHRIVKICSDSEYSTFYLSNGSIITSSYSLSDYMAKLPSGHFGRYCDNCIVNLEYVRDYSTRKVWQLTIENRKLVPVKPEYSSINFECRERFKKDFYKYGNK